MEKENKEELSRDVDVVNQTGEKNIFAKQIETANINTQNNFSTVTYNISTPDSKFAVPWGSSNLCRNYYILFVSNSIKLDETAKFPIPLRRFIEDSSSIVEALIMKSKIFPYSN
ncbi:MAG: hypothetical protein R3Y63_04800 [Eubacteriales bacterium]